MSINREIVSMGTFSLNSPIADPGTAAAKIEKRFKDLGYEVETSLEEKKLQLKLHKSGLFPKVPGLFPFIAATLCEGSDQCDISIMFAKTNGFETTMLGQLLRFGPVIVDPCPMPTIPRYDQMVGSLFHKSTQERDIGIFHTKEYGKEIVTVINECL